MVEIVIERQRTEVHRAIMEFVARRSYRLTSPWYVDGMRIEAPQHTEWRLRAEGIADQLDHHIRDPRKKTWWATLLDLPQVPRIDLGIARRRGRTVVNVKISNHPGSTKLAGELHAQLLDDRAYDAQGLSSCRACGAPISNIIARYCGRCGRPLASTKATDSWLSPAAAALERQPASTVPQRSAPAAEAAPRASGAAAPEAPSQSLAEAVGIVEPIENTELEEDSSDTATTDTAIAAAPLDTHEEVDSPPNDEPAREAMAEADDDVEPPQRALAED